MNGKRILSGLTAALLLVGSLPRAGALTGLSPWAAEAAQAAEAGLEPGALTWAPAKEPVTRAEFCSISLTLFESLMGCTLERTGAVWFDDCDDPDVNTAYEQELVAGKGGGLFAPEDTITRQDLCVMLRNVLAAAGAEAAGDLSMLNTYTDSGAVSPYAQESVAVMLENGILVGAGGKLDPRGTASREQALILAYRLFNDYRLYFDTGDAYGAIAIPVFGESDSAPAPDTYEKPTGSLIIPLAPDRTPEAADTQPEADGPAPAAIDRYDLSAMDDEDKLALVYGEDGAPYEDEETARAHMVEIEVPVWRLTSDGEKIESTAFLTVHEALADTLTDVFIEIFEGDEQFPIANVGGFAWRSNTRSEHRQGTAIDINWESNMEADVDEDGTLIPTTGDHWLPGEDPLSIPADGDVVRAFKRHGFSWGGDAWNDKVDYMHFSFFGR